VTRPRAHRLGALVLSCVVTAGTLGVALSAPAAAAPPTAATAAVDFATERWGDPWDFSNGEDLLLDGGPTMGLRDAAIRGGQLSFGMAGPGYVSPLWGGYPGSLYLGRDGLAPQNRIDAGRFTRLSFSMWSDRDVAAGVQWFGGADGQTWGGQPVEVRSGWHTYDLRLDNRGYGLPQAWAGQIAGLRLALSPSEPTRVAVDWMRLYAPSATVSVPPGTQWDVNDVAADNTPGRPGWGTVDCGAATCDLSFLPPGSYWMVEAGASTGPVVLRRPAAPVVLDPDEVGGEDYAAADPWDFDGPQDVLEVRNADVLGVGGGRLTARNAGPTVNDPFAWLRLRTPTIDSGRFHRLTVRSGYEGPFDLRDTAGGGSMGRVVWRPADSPDKVQQTEDVVTYSGTRSVTLDLAAPGVHENDPAAGPARAWSAAPVSGIRWDPNEDHGARTWWLERFALRADDEAGSSFDVRWYDAGFTPGSTVTLYRQNDRAGGGRQVLAAGVPQRPGTNVFRWDSGATAPGTYWIAVEVNGPAGAATAVSSGPVRVVGGGAQGQGASPATPLVRDLGDACPQSRVPEDGFADVDDGSVHESAVDCLAWWAITTPVGGYAPAGVVTRGQMASFLRRVVERSGGTLPAGGNAFGDDDGSTHEGAIDALAKVGLVGGFTDGSYRPSAPVTREQMATFLVRIAEHRSGGPLGETADFFRDDASSAHQANINKAAGAGVASGTGEQRYSPAPSVRRDQMGTFLVRLLDLLVSAGNGAPPLR
jgi:hypothetical protein